MDYKARSCLLLSSTDPNACMCVNASIVTLWFSLKMKELFLTGCWWMMFCDNTHNDLEHFLYGILPKIIGKWLTRQPISDKENVVQTPVPSIAEIDEEDYEKVWCNCNQPNHGEMVYN